MKTNGEWKWSPLSTVRIRTHNRSALKSIWWWSNYKLIIQIRPPFLSDRFKLIQIRWDAKTEIDILTRHRLVLCAKYFGLTCLWLIEAWKAKKQKQKNENENDYGHSKHSSLRDTLDWSRCFCSKERYLYSVSIFNILFNSKQHIWKKCVSYFQMF